MKVLLSIKPEFANKIFEGTKRFEFRKSIFKKEVKTVVVYASSPLQQVIGEFEIEQVLHLDLDTLWNITRSESGISESFFYKYFEDKEWGYAIEIKNVKKYEEPQNLKETYNLFPPQSFAYL
ncbi:ASCH domain-containing protein [Capnocytophaga sputigena]|uniref:ASCH domain-containing protein n=1 Tax=Capnocytophaga sputigena TaxID=1019 RepID=UPI0028E608FD|nr:ASCH domain-containing protein [Capnocytophaga sputigena]